MIKCDNTIHINCSGQLPKHANRMFRFFFHQIFEVSEDSVGLLCPKYNLEPPHYDGIQSLCLMGDLLFSGSRDTCIKKWDLAEQQLKQVRGQNRVECMGQRPKWHGGRGQRSKWGGGFRNFR